MSLFSTGFSLARPLLHALDAEAAHHLTLKSLRALPSCTPVLTPGLRQTLFGLEFSNPLGLAPGFDKNAEAPDALLGLGFGFVEVGTVTPRPQAGNPRPRLFRLTEDQAVINRMGFNNVGFDAVARRLEKRRAMGGIIGINIGANKDSVDRIADYAAGVARFGGLASYLTINISSPNTPGLRNLQGRDELLRLFDAINSARAKLAKPVPMLLKIAPDLGEDDLATIAAGCAGGAVDGIIVSNTTLARPDLRSLHRAEAGGLSGRPLFELSTRQLAKLRILTGGLIPLIGVGGISDARTAIAKLEAGASLIQLYSALVFKGPALIGEIHEGLLSHMEGRPLSTLIGSRAKAIANGEAILSKHG